jgi:hypothetical protein
MSYRESLERSLRDRNASLAGRVPRREPTLARSIPRDQNLARRIGYSFSLYDKGRHIAAACIARQSAVCAPSKSGSPF